MPPNVTWNPKSLKIPAAPNGATATVEPAGRMPAVPLTNSATAPVTPPVPLVTASRLTSVPWWAPPNVSVKPASLSELTATVPPTGHPATPVPPLASSRTALVHGAGAVDDRDRRDINVRRGAGERQREAAVARGGRRDRARKAGDGVDRRRDVCVRDGEAARAEYGGQAPAQLDLERLGRPVEAGQDRLLLLVSALESVLDARSGVVLPADDRVRVRAAVVEREGVAVRVEAGDGHDLHLGPALEGFRDPGGRVVDVVDDRRRGRSLVGEREGVGRRAAVERGRDDAGDADAVDHGERRDVRRRQRPAEGHVEAGGGRCAGGADRGDRGHAARREPGDALDGRGDARRRCSSCR